jgi:hypothetical protein
MEAIRTYIIGIANSEADGVRLYRVKGTETQVKKHLLQLVKDDKANDKDNYDYGTDTIKSIEVQSDGSLDAYAVYGDYHIDYTAVREKEPLIL